MRDKSEDSLFVRMPYSMCIYFKGFFWSCSPGESHKFTVRCHIIKIGFIITENCKTVLFVHLIDSILSAGYVKKSQNILVHLV